MSNTKRPRVLDVGNCGPDHAAIRSMLERHFGAEVVQTHHLADTLAAVRDRNVDLILVNRKLDADYSDGLEVVRQLQADAQLARIPVMLVSNYPQYQDEAVETGCRRGFGKQELGDAETHRRLAAILAAD